MSDGNAAQYFVSRHLADDRGSATAFIEAGEASAQISYAELEVETSRVVDLFKRNDIRREERVAMLVLDEIAFPVIFWGSLKAGVIPIPLNTLLGTEVYAAILEDCRARALFVSAPLLPSIEGLLQAHSSIRNVFVIGREPSDSFLSFEAEIARSEPHPAVTANADETAFWLYSSGSTGQPKGVRHVHGSLRATADTYGAGVLAIDQDDIIYSAAKLNFAYGLGNAMTFPMSVGATTVLYPGRPTPELVSQLLAEHEPTIFCGVPTLYAALLDHYERASSTPSKSLRCCISAGEALPEDVGKRWREVSGVDILDGVGSTEMLHIFLSNRPGDVVYGSSGLPVPGYDLRLLDEAGEEAVTGAVGELLVNGPSAADGYWNQREKTRATFEGVWTRTGDKFTRSEDGRYVYCGRTDDMFKVSGIWVSPFEVEQALVSHPCVLEAAVVARQDRDKLDKPAAFVVLTEGEGTAELAEELRVLVKQRIGKWKYPRSIEFLSDLPRTATGKIQRYKLKIRGR